jgi:dihydrofolate synthase/folylpolyglutamate synthase
LNHGAALHQWLQRAQHTHPRSIELGLERVRSVAAALALLPLARPCVIVGGTNGKGSTATLLASCLQAAGWRTGLFTSPHLQRYNERIAVDAQPATDAELVQAFERIEAARGAVTLTYFEYNTLAALVVFRQREVAAMVLEVGLGGRLDATNVVDADIAVLCSVGMDHTEWLGETRGQIGAEKAGIFRPGRPVVLGHSDMPDTVYTAARVGCCLLSVAEQDFRWESAGTGRWRYADAAGVLENLPEPALHGAIQLRNAATALAAARQLAGPVLLPGLYQTAVVARALTGVRLRGRLQLVPGPVEWLIDVAHNPAAASVLREAVAARPPARRTLAVFGMLADKDAAAVAAIMDAQVDCWLLCGTEGERGLDSAQLQQRIGATRGRQQRFASVAAACAAAQAQAETGERVLVFGSFHVVGPALEALGL